MADRSSPSTFDAASRLFGAYLHQDWALEFDSPDAAVRAMIEGEPVASVMEAAADIRRLLETGSDEAGLSRVMTGEAGCFYDPSASGQSWRGWLQEVAAQLERRNVT